MLTNRASFTVDISPHVAIITIFENVMDSSGPTFNWSILIVLLPLLGNQQNFKSVNLIKLKSAGCLFVLSVPIQTSGSYSRASWHLSSFVIGGEGSTFNNIRLEQE